jgi:hypothetical protein
MGGIGVMLNGTSETEIERRDGYVIVTPRSERAAWPTLNSDLNALDYPMTFTGMGMNSTWMGMGSEGMSPFNGIAGADDVGSGGQQGEGGKNQELDFFSF